MTAKVFLNRDNESSIHLLQEGRPPIKNAVTKAEIHIPGSAFSDGEARTLDSDSNNSNIKLIEDATIVKISLGNTEITPGSHLCYLTCYDPINVNGIAWDTIRLEVKTWP